MSFVPLLHDGSSARNFPDLPTLSKPLDALVIAPHPDDAELGMGGTIVKLIQSGWNIGVLDLTSGEPTPHGSLEIRGKETALATAELGLKWRYNMGWTNRELEPTLAHRHELASLIRLVRPRWLFAPYWEDAHPDHLAATQLVEAARFWSKLSKTDLAGEPFHPERILYYFCIHLRLAIQPTFVVDISQEWSAKAKSIACYQSQFVAGRNSQPPTFLDRLQEEAGYWGKSIGTTFGEPFAMREPLGLRDLDRLV